MASAARDRAKGRDATDVFFAELATRGSEPLMHDESGTVRFELAEGAKTERYLVEVDKGTLKVSQRLDRPDAVVRVDRSLFNGMAEGRVNAMASVLRGLVTIEGDLGIVASFIRLFPGPPASLKSYLRRRRAVGAAP